MDREATAQQHAQIDVLRACFQSIVAQKLAENEFRDAPLRVSPGRYTAAYFDVTYALRPFCF